jgi:riboflavin kinase/FMN adenylyltransferase
MLEEIGIDQIFLAPTTTEFLSLSKREFLDMLNKEYTVLGYCSGKDYRFGAKGQGDVEYLSQYAKENNQILEVVEDFIFEGQKVSTTLIKEYLTEGKIEKANQLLGREYSVNGRVIKDRGLGSKLGFPTANIKVGQEKFPLKNGVYSGKVILGEKAYKAVVNFGARPTFSLKEVLIEAHLLDFNGDLYDKELTIYLDRFLRDVKTFENVNDLKVQIAKDVEKVKDFND